MPRIQLPDGRTIEVPNDMAPDQLDSMLAELTQASTPAAETRPADDPRAGASRLRPGAGESKDAFIERSMDAWGDGTLPGLTKIGAAPGPIRTMLSKIAPSLMRNALGAQQGIRGKFPTVDLEQVALREGAIPGSKASIAGVQASAKAAGKAVNAAADAAPMPARVTRRMLINSIRPLYQQASMAADEGAQQAVVDRMRQIASEVDGAGLSMREGQARKQLLAQRGKAARSAATPKDAAFGAQIADAERKAITAAQRSSGGMADALDRSQELMALERAMTRTGQRTSILRDALAASTGTGAGLMTGNLAAALVTAPAAVAMNRAITSPQVLGRLANAAHRGGQRPSTGTLQSLLAQLMASHGQE
jgi:hypothetical protein